MDSSRPRRRATGSRRRCDRSRTRSSCRRARTSAGCRTTCSPTILVAAPPAIGTRVEVAEQVEDDRLAVRRDVERHPRALVGRERDGGGALEDQPRLVLLVLVLVGGLLRGDGRGGGEGEDGGDGRDGRRRRSSIIETPWGRRGGLYAVGGRRRARARCRWRPATFDVTAARATSRVAATAPRLAAVLARREIVSARALASLGAAASRDALQRHTPGGLHRRRCSGASRITGQGLAARNRLADFRLRRELAALPRRPARAPSRHPRRRTARASVQMPLKPSLTRHGADRVRAASTFPPNGAVAGQTMPARRAVRVPAAAPTPVRAPSRHPRRSTAGAAVRGAARWRWLAGDVRSEATAARAP